MKIKLRTHRERNPMNGDIEFGPYRLTKDGRLFCPDGAEVHLSKRLRCTLFELVAKKGAVVTRTHLIERCWPDDTIGEDNLTRAIADLRKILRTHGAECIETVYGLGYRLDTGHADSDLRETASFCQEARERIHHRQRATLDAADYLFNQVVTRDEGHLPAWLGLAETQIHRMQLGYTTTMESALQARAFLDRALDLNPSCADALAFKGLLLTWADWDFAGAEALMKRACELDLNGFVTNQAAAWHKLALGEFESAERHSRVAAAASPLTATARGVWAFARLHRGDARAALDVAREMVRIDAHGSVSLGLAAIFEAALGSPAKAVAMAEQSYDLLPESPVAGAILAYTLAREGRVEKARALLESETKAGLPIGSNTMASPAWTELGENGLAMSALESGFETRCTWLLPMLNDPRIGCLDCKPLKDTIFK
jgi:DNA-binding winged helix-turn-helix (wHTH) protein